MLVGFFVFQGENTSKAEAANAANFNPGNIISDAIFFDGSALTAAQVQSFLNSQVSVCRVGYTCLKDFRQTTPSRAAVPGQCSAYMGASNERASDIIAKVGQACGISQKVLLVLLQKEQGLVTDTWPIDVQYRSATGYGCPDTAACDSQFYGFFNQVYNAAKQFKNYAANPTRWNYVAGRVNTILFNPNRACGSSNIFIANQATAGLYIYTPYQPNAAALANLYGTGDSCSAYGNRNFWRLFSDWFGNTNTTALVRTIENPMVYLLTNGSKYPIPNLSIFQEYRTLGAVSFVSKAFLDALPTAQNASKIVREPTGGIFYLDNGSKFRLPTCEMVIHFGGSCSSTGYVQLDQNMSNTFRAATDITQVIVNNSGFRYFVGSGFRSELLNLEAQENNNLGDITTTQLSDGALSEMPWASFIGPREIFVKAPNSPRVFFISQTTWRPVNTFEALQAISNQVNPRIYSVSPGAIENAPRGPEISTPLSAGISLGGAWAVGSYIKSLGSPKVFRVGESEIRPANSWEALVHDAGNNNPIIRTVPESLILSSPIGNSLPEPIAQNQEVGPSGFIVGSLIKTPNSPNIFLVTSREIRLVASWNVLVAISNSSNPAITTVSTSQITSIPRGGNITSPLATGIQLSGIWSNGSLVKSNQSPIVYQISNGVLRPIASWRALLSLTAPNTPTIHIVDPSLLIQSPIGAVIS